MTSPDNTATANTDAPVATVPWGLSELGAYLLALAGLLNGYLGHDYGLSKNAQAISLLLGGGAVIFNNISRAIKHHAAIHANAAVYLAQLSEVGAALKTNAGKTVTPQALAAGVTALNQAVAADTATTPDKPKTRS